MRTRQFNREVLYPDEAIVKMGRADLESLKQCALANERKRMRLCAHPGVEDSLHEMFIVLTAESYVAPHKHLGKSVSYHVIEGQADIVLFHDDGRIADVISLGTCTGPSVFYFRMSHPWYYIPAVRSRIFAFQETTNGPLNPADTVYAPWAPPESDPAAGRVYLARLQQDIADYKGTLS